MLAVILDMAEAEALAVSVVLDVGVVIAVNVVVAVVVVVMLVMAMDAANTSSGCMTSSDIPETALKSVQNRYLNHHFGDRYFSRVSLFFLILIVVLLRTR